MGIKEALGYRLGVDFLKSRLQEERALVGTNDKLPIEAGGGTALTVYVRRLQTMVEYPAVLARRNLGFANPQETSGE